MAPKALPISETLALPLDGKSGSPGAVTQKYAFLGRTGSGKTYGATKLAELMLEAGAQVVALDPVGVWAFLRIGPKPFSLPVLGGLYGDVPLEATGGAAVADFIVSTGSSAVLDVSQFTSAEQARFATAFAERFFQRKKALPSAVHLFIEECQEFVPQNASGGEAHMLHQFERLVKLGRNFGIGVSLISQRPQEVNKKALNQTECLFAFQMTGPQERKAIAGWAADKGLDVDLVEALPKLAVGHAHAWSPQWLGVSKEIVIAKKRTADGSATPQVGAAGGGWKLSPVDLPALRATMAETVERAKADDPKALREQLRRVTMERDELAAQLDGAVAPGPAEIVEVPAFDLAAFGSLHEGILQEFHALKTAADEAEKRAHRLLEDYENPFRDGVRSPKVHPSAPKPRPVPLPVSVQPRGETLKEKAARYRDVKPDDALGNGSLRRVLIALAQRPNGLTRRQITARAGVSTKSSTFRNNVARAKAEEWITEDGGTFSLTKAGRSSLGRFEPLPEGEELRRYWYAELGQGVPGKIFGAIARAYPKALTREQIGEHADTSIGSSTFRNALAQLKNLEIIEADGRGFRMSEELE